MTWPRWLYKLNDPADLTFGADKLHHLLGATALASFVATWQGDAQLGWWAAMTAGFIVEFVQVSRWATWQRGIANGTASRLDWPAFADKVSLKDIVADLAGAFAGVGAYLLLARLL